MSDQWLDPINDVVDNITPSGVVKGQIKKQLKKECKKKLIPKPPKGKGAVPPGQRDPKRVWTKKEKKDELERRGGKCDGCGKDLDINDARGHHIKRHADGGMTDKDNMGILCDPCHKDIHK